MFIFLPYYLFQGNDPLWEPVIWSVVFTGVNVYQIISLFLERRPVVISEKENKIYNDTFSSFTIRQFAKLLKFSKLKFYESSEAILEQEVVPDKVMFVVDGEAIIENKGASLLQLKSGDFIGDVSYITGNPNKFKVKAKDNAEIIFWNRQEFEKAIEADPSMKASWQSLISQKLAQKLSAAH